MEKIEKDIKFNQNVWRKPYIDIKTDLKKTKNDFEKDFFEWMNNINFEKTTKYVRKHRDIKLVTTGRRNYFMSETNYHTTTVFTKHQRYL